MALDTAPLLPHAPAPVSFNKWAFFCMFITLCCDAVGNWNTLNEFSENRYYLMFVGVLLAGLTIGGSYAVFLQNSFNQRAREQETLTDAEEEKENEDDDRVLAQPNIGRAQSFSKIPLTCSQKLLSTCYILALAGGYAGACVLIADIITEDDPTVHLATTAVAYPLFIVLSRGLWHAQQTAMKGLALLKAGRPLPPPEPESCWDHLVEVIELATALLGGGFAVSEVMSTLAEKRFPRDLLYNSLSTASLPILLPLVIMAAIATGQAHKATSAQQGVGREVLPCLRGRSFCVQFSVNLAIFLGDYLAHILDTGSVLALSYLSHKDSIHEKIPLPQQAVLAIIVFITATGATADTWTNAQNTQFARQLGQFFRTCRGDSGRIVHREPSTARDAISAVTKYGSLQNGDSAQPTNRV